MKGTGLLRVHRDTDSPSWSHGETALGLGHTRATDEAMIKESFPHGDQGSRLYSNKAWHPIKEANLPWGLILKSQQPKLVQRAASGPVRHLVVSWRNWTGVSRVQGFSRSK